MLRFDVADQGPEVLGDGAELRPVLLAGRPQEPLTPHQGADPFLPPAPTQLRDHDGDQGDRRPQADEEVEEVALGLLAAALHEAHVVDEHELPAGGGAGREGPDRDQELATGGLDDVTRRSRVARQGAARDGGRDRLGPDGDSFKAPAVPDREDPLVLRDSGEELEQARPIAADDKVLQGLLDGVGDEGGADVEVADEPLEGEPLDQGEDPVGDGGERQDQRDDEPEGKSHQRDLA